MVHIKPSTTGGLPSTKSAGFMLTNLMRLLAKNCKAVLALLRKCGRLKTRPFSTGKRSPDNTSKRAINFVPSRKSLIKSSTRSGGIRYTKKKMKIN